jgi:hypothetical protein
MTVLRPDGLVFLKGLMMLLAIALAGTLVRLVYAHGGGTPRLTNTEVGPYWVSIWTQPEPVRVGTIHFTVAVSEPSGAGTTQAEPGVPVLDASVNIQLDGLDQPAPTLTGAATHAEAVNKLFYETDLTVPVEGRWRATVSVDGPAGSGQTSFELQVLPASAFGLNWLWIGGLGLVLVLLSGWLYHSRG